MDFYLVLKSLHIVAMVAWFAGLFYLPRLFVYHADTRDDAGSARFKLMERRLYNGITTPAGIVTTLLGIAMIAERGIEWLLDSSWLLLKLGLVVALVVFHLYLGHLVRGFARDANAHSAKFYRWINELPLVVLVPAVMLAEIKPW